MIQQPRGGKKDEGVEGGGVGKAPKHHLGHMFLGKCGNLCVILKCWLNYPVLDLETLRKGVKLHMQGGGRAGKKSDM